MTQFPRWMMDDWQGSHLRRPAKSRLVRLGGIETVFEGAVDDLYFQSIEQHALGLDGLAALVAAQVPPASTVVDVGANIGLSTILLARSAQRVIAFEPSPANVGYLRRNLASNGIANVEVVAAAVSDRPGPARCVSMSRSSAPDRTSWRPAMCRATPSPRSTCPPSPWTRR